MNTSTEASHPRIGLLGPQSLRQYFCRLERVPLSAVEWPLGPPAGDGCLGDLSADDHLILSTTSRTMLALRWRLRCKVSALIFEPPAIQRRWYRWLRLVGPLMFHRVFTHLPSLATAIPNGRLVPHGTATFSHRTDQPPPKTALVAIVASHHRSLPGHRMRHRVVDWAREHGLKLETFGTGYRPIADKWEGHAPFRYSVVIENSRSPGYFTEKIIDSFLAWSVPVYWGDPEISRAFLPDGMIACESEEEIKERLLTLSDADFDRRLHALRENERRARLFAPSMFERAARIIVEEHTT